MNDYILFADSACDIPFDTLKDWGVEVFPLTFHFDGEDTVYTDADLEKKEFYQRVRDGGKVNTAAINVDEYLRRFEEPLAAGHDVLYIGFSSGLSSSFRWSVLAAEELQAKYPERVILSVDSLSASAGYGMLVYLAVQQKRAGMGIRELYQYVQDTRLRVCHWFTVSDLQYLYRGGRVSRTAAVVGGMLDIKPVLHVDDEGHLINMSKVRGRKASLKALVDRYGQLADDPAHGLLFFCHGDCIEDVDYVCGLIRERYGNEPDRVVYTGTVIGGHSGPGTLAVFFLGSMR